jgi:hypothetical protein
MTRWRQVNLWLLQHPRTITVFEVALLILLWVLAITTARVASYVFAILWTVLIVVIRPIQTRRTR